MKNSSSRDLHAMSVKECSRYAIFNRVKIFKLRKKSDPMDKSYTF